MKQNSRSDIQTYSLFVILAGLTMAFVLLLQMVLFAPAGGGDRSPSGDSATPVVLSEH